MLDEIETIEDIWKTMSKGYNETEDIILGIKEKGQKPNSKSERLKRSLRNKYYIEDVEIKRSMRNDRRKWTEDMITDAERAASYGHKKTLY